MLWVFLALVAMDLASTAVSIPVWAYIVYLLVAVVIVGITVASK